jgi:diguanylate cyclase (GGDEF)-like protein
VFTDNFGGVAGIAFVGFVLGCACKWPRTMRSRVEVTRLRWLAEHDSLTGLPNRVAAECRLKCAVSAGTRCAAVLLDLDDFKAVNDTWGHQVGDAQLLEVAGRLAALCEPLDVFVSRLAGDEFLLLIPQADLGTIMDRVTEILSRLSAPMRLRAGGSTTSNITVSASAGIAILEDDLSWTDLMRRADIALYEAKVLGGHAVLFVSGMHQPMPSRVRPSGRLREQRVLGRYRSAAKV